MADGGATVGATIDLDALNAKQLTKEFKAAGKGVKSKDPVVKAEALGKLSNIRYYTEGGALLSLVEQMIPKKVNEGITEQVCDVLREWIVDDADVSSNVLVCAHAHSLPISTLFISIENDG